MASESSALPESSAPLSSTYSSWLITPPLVPPEALFAAAMMASRSLPPEEITEGSSSIGAVVFVTVVELVALMAVVTLSPLRKEESGRAALVLFNTEGVVVVMDSLRRGTAVALLGKAASAATRGAVVLTAVVFVEGFGMMEVMLTASGVAVSENFVTAAVVDAFLPMVVVLAVAGAATALPPQATAAQLALIGIVVDACLYFMLSVAAVVTLNSTDPDALQGAFHVSDMSATGREIGFPEASKRLGHWSLLELLKVPVLAVSMARRLSGNVTVSL